MSHLITVWLIQMLAVIASVTALVLARHAWLTLETREGAGKFAGPTGEDGQFGFLGPQGLRGITGPQGPIGVTGVVGGAGPIGPTGFTGGQGTSGQIGPLGYQGPVGPIVFTGPTGVTGFTGFNSLTGMTGPASSSINTGTTGSTGPTGTPSLAYLSTVYTLNSFTLISPITAFNTPLHLSLLFLANNSLGLFTYSDGVITFLSQSLSSTFNVRVTMSGFITGAITSSAFAAITFSGIPLSLSPGVTWTLGTAYAAGSSQYVFSSTISDSFNPSLLSSTTGNFAFKVLLSSSPGDWVSNPQLTVSNLSIEIVQIAS